MPLTDYIRQLLATALPAVQQDFSNLSQFALFGPQGVQQAHEDARAHEALLQALNIHNSLSPYEAAQVQQMHDADQRAQTQQVLNALNLGMKPTTSGGTPDMTISGHGFNYPDAPQTYSIPANSEMGKAYGLTQDVTGLTGPQYLQVTAPFASKKLAESDKQAAQAQLDIQKTHAKQWLSQRFSPSYYESLYGKGAIDPTASLEAQNLSNQLDSVITQSDMEKWQNAARGYKTAWEARQEANMKLKAELAAKQQATSQSDPHLSQAIQFQNTQLGRIEKPIRDEYDEGTYLKAMLTAGTPASDALAAPLMNKYTTGLKRFSDTELHTIRNGATMWTNAQQAFNKWSSDPNRPQMPTAMRQQWLQLVDAKQGNLKRQLDLIDDTYSDLANSNTAAEAYKIGSNFHRKLSAGTASASPAQTGNRRFTYDPQRGLVQQ